MKKTKGRGGRPKKIRPPTDWREMLIRYVNAIDDIYNSGKEGRGLVVKHFGLCHPVNAIPFQGIKK